jgi:hypothetical protein
LIADFRLVKDLSAANSSIDEVENVQSEFLGASLQSFGSLIHGACVLAHSAPQSEIAKNLKSI